ncbi:MAG: hypothetical protein Q9192_004157 [Flavoplaca navasiana]
MSLRWTSSPLLFTLSICSLLVSSVLGKCECGYSVKGQGIFSDAFEADFLRQDDIVNDKDWDIQQYNQSAWEPFTGAYRRDNVISNPLAQASRDPGLQLYVRGPTEKGGQVSVAELVTKREDMQYGSFRAAIRTPTVAGTCASMFWMRAGPQDFPTKQEIDFEMLSYEDTDASPQKKIHLVLHGRSVRKDTETDEDVPQVPFRPSDGFHEYRFDWSPGKVVFFVDGQHIRDFTDRVPTEPGRILLNHWSHGQPGWEHGPPEKDALMTVAYVKAYFNTKSPLPKCVDPEAKDAVCEVPDQVGPVSPETPTTFLTDVDAISGNYGSTDSVNPSTTPSKPSSGKISPDNKCGGDEGFTCLNGPAGDCCSSAGWWYVRTCSSPLHD